MKTKAAKLLTVNSVLFLLATAVSGYLVHHHYEIVNGEAGFGSFCSINQTIDCDAVNASKYSEFLGIPIATWALGYYLFALLVSIIGARNAFSRREALLLLFPFSSLSLLASFVMFFVSASLLHKYCLMCGTLQALNLATFVLSLLALRDYAASTGFVQEWHEANRRRMVTLAACGIVLFLGTAVATAQLRHTIDFDVAKFVENFRAKPAQSIDIGNSPRQGFKGDNPPVRLVEFADFQCPACGNTARLMHHLIRKYEDKVQLVFKNFPLNSSCNLHLTTRMHEYACLGAQAAHCADEQGKFVDFYEKLFGNQKEINPENVDKWAVELGLNMDNFKKCLTADATQELIRKDTDLAVALGVDATPSLYANGKKVDGMMDENKLKLIIDELTK